MLIDSPRAKENTQIKEFASLVEANCGDGCFHFETFETEPFRKFWPQTLILEFLPPKNDFVVKYWGTALARKYDHEVTGSKTCELCQDKQEEILMTNHKKVIHDRKKLYFDHEIDCAHGGEIAFLSVVFPMMHGDVFNETISYNVFSDDCLHLTSKPALSF